MDTPTELIAPDVAWHVPGDNLTSGTCTSREGIFALPAESVLPVDAGVAGSRRLRMA
jgi:hypothetical protein